MRQFFMPTGDVLAIATTPSACTTRTRTKLTDMLPVCGAVRAGPRFTFIFFLFT